MKSHLCRCGHLAAPVQVIMRCLYMISVVALHALGFAGALALHVILVTSSSYHTACSNACKIGGRGCFRI